jgi:hypothetical protein
LLAGDTGAGAVLISDGGVTAPAFFDRSRRRPIINAPSTRPRRCSPA